MCAPLETRPTPADPPTGSTSWRSNGERRPNAAGGSAPMSRPQRYLRNMAIFLVAVVLVAAALGQALVGFFMGNTAVNGVIVGIMLAGIIYIFWQVSLLNPE